MKKYIPLILLCLLTACSSSNEEKSAPPPLDTKGLDILTGQFSRNIDNIWGVDELLVASRQDYVKYTDNYYTRSHINFASGLITIGTLATPQDLQRSIIHTLLMGDNPSGIDLFDTGDVPISSKPFLKGLIVNEKGEFIDNVVNATDFANYLIKNRLKARKLTNGRIVHYVEIQMVSNHTFLRAKKFLPLVQESSRRYQVDTSLILGIMEVESAFNPYAVSYANALGLMQVVQKTAGADVFKAKGLRGLPSRKYLFNPRNNIDAGTLYLSLLQGKYLDGITNKQSLRYMVITSYNAGAGMTLRMFDSDRDRAIAKINRMTPEALYKKLTRSHPSAQARNYLLKVTKAEKNYRVFS